MKTTRALGLTCVAVFCQSPHSTGASNPVLPDMAPCEFLSSLECFKNVEKIELAETFRHFQNRLQEVFPTVEEPME
jgi:hypothetical protein